MQRYSPISTRRHRLSRKKVTVRRARLRALLVETWHVARRGMGVLLLLGSGMVGPVWGAGPDIYSVSNESEFNNAITHAVAGDTIQLSANISLTASLNTLTYDVTIDGQGHRINGNYNYRPFFVESGDVTIKNLTVANGTAQGGYGGAGAQGGGGGLGAGGGVFVESGANVILSDVRFDDNFAFGGGGGLDLSKLEWWRGWWISW